MAVAGHSGDEPGARRGLADPAPEVRATALGALRRMGRLVLEDLGGAAGDESAVVRTRAAELACHLNRPEARQLAVELLEDDEARVVEAACFALGEMGPSLVREGPDPAVAALSSVCATHPDPLCREAAVAALGAIGDAAGLRAILAAAADRAPVRRRAVLALAPFDGPLVDEVVERALHDRDWQVRQAAEDISAPPGPVGRGDHASPP